MRLARSLWPHAATARAAVRSQAPCPAPPREPLLARGFQRGGWAGPLRGGEQSATRGRLGVPGGGGGPQRGMAKRKEGGDAEAQPSSKKASSAERLWVHPKRLQVLKDGRIGKGPVIYWMSRDHRCNDNWALLYACDMAAASGTNVAVAFNLVPQYLNAGARHFGFMLRSLKLTAPKLEKLNIPFFLLQGDPGETIPQLVKDCGAGLLVVDYGPLRVGRQWRDKVKANLGDVPFHEIDTHNVVPVWVASDKKEYAARTIRPKIHRNLSEFMTDFPATPQQAPWPEDLPQPPATDWDAVIKEVIERGKEVPEIDWAEPGEDAGLKAAQAFASKERLKKFVASRNDPTERGALSGLSAWLHYGQLSTQRVALMVNAQRSVCKEGAEGYIEEMVVRRELAENFCHYEPNYDNIKCASDWARKSLDLHRKDLREHLYTREQLERGETYDTLWNAAQLEMVHHGKMHGFMRMYWAKKILEWTEGPERAIADSIWLNDKYEIDGRDCNGYVGCMWSCAGIHDQGWAERPIFGKIRYMAYSGCKRKFNVDGYIKVVDKLLQDKGLGRKCQWGA